MLQNVYYVPELNCNSVFISRLVDDLKCTVHFTNTLCVIQDLYLRTLIGIGERRDRLYYFRDLPRICALPNNGIASSNLWHQRLGHPSDKVVRSLPFFNKSTSFSNKACDICHQAKHTRTQFPLNDNRATSRLEIVHCDLWGKYHTPASCGATYFLTLIDNYSKVVWLYLLFDKTKVCKMFNSFFSMIERQFNARVKGCAQW